MSEGGNGCDHSCELRTHAAAVVDDQTDGYGSVFLLEESELLRTAILEDAEILESHPETTFPFVSVTRTGSATSAESTEIVAEAAESEGGDCERPVTGKLHKSRTAASG